MNQDYSSLENNTSFAWVDQIYRDHGKFIESVIRFAVKDSQESDDIYQEVFMALLKVSNPSQIKDIKDYLYILTINKVNEHAWKRHRGKQVLKGYADFLSRLPAAASGDPVAVREEAARMLNIVENCLTKKESEAVLRRFRDTTDTDQAAKAMHISKKSFVRYVSVGVKKIRAIVRSTEKTDS